VHENRNYCYTEVGACADGQLSGHLNDTEWSFAACGIPPNNYCTPDLVLGPTPFLRLAANGAVDRSDAEEVARAGLTQARNNAQHVFEQAGCRGGEQAGVCGALGVGMAKAQREFNAAIANDPAAKDFVDEGYCIQADRMPANMAQGLDPNPDIDNVTAATCKVYGLNGQRNALPTDGVWSRQRFGLTHDGEFRMLIGDEALKGQPDGQGARARQW